MIKLSVAQIQIRSLPSFACLLIRYRSYLHLIPFHHYYPSSDLSNRHTESNLRPSFFVEIDVSLAVLLFHASTIRFFQLLNFSYLFSSSHTMIAICSLPLDVSFLVLFLPTTLKPAHDSSRHSSNLLAMM